MRHLIRYIGYSTDERVDDILDKIFKYGISSITSLEKDFLDARSIGKEKELHDLITKEESEKIFEDDHGYFKFEHTDTKNIKNRKHYIGIFYVSDLQLENGKIIEGRLEGEVILFSCGKVSYNFQKMDGRMCYDILDFCGGLEYELDNFIDYLIQELDN